MQRIKMKEMSRTKIKKFRKDLVGTPIEFMIDYIQNKDFPHLHLYYIHDFPRLLNHSTQELYSKDLVDKVIQVAEEEDFDLEMYQTNHLSEKDHERLFNFYKTVENKIKEISYKNLLCPNTFNKT